MKKIFFLLGFFILWNALLSMDNMSVTEKLTEFQEQKIEPLTYDVFTLGIEGHTLNIEKKYDADYEEKVNLPEIVHLSFSGSVILPNPKSFIRILIRSADGREFSVYEAGFPFEEKTSFDKTYWRYKVVDNQWCYTEASGCQNYDGEMGVFSEYASGVRLPEESCHVIEFYSTDLLGNSEAVKRQCVFVDNTKPTSTKIIGEPKVVKTEGTFITQQTPITISCVDGGDHPVNHVSLWYRYRFADDCVDLDEAAWTNWIDPEFTIPDESKTIYFSEDSCHELEYYCEDILGNEEAVQREIDIVDTKAPVITKTIRGPSYGQCPPKPGSDDICYIDGVTEIVVDVKDSEPHPVGDVKCQWWYTLDNLDNIYGPYDTFPINFPEESRHNLIIECKDALGNIVRDEETFFVDKTGPNIWKSYGEPFRQYQFDTYWAKWITSKTPIVAGVSDIGVHLSGIKEVKYRTIMVDDELCKYTGEIPDTYTCDNVDGSTSSWTYVDPNNFGRFEFKIGEDSCHLMEIMATDNVDKCTLHKQWVYVDNQAPEPNKTVEEPATEWFPVDVQTDPFDPDATHFYPWIVDKCWNDGEDSIDCWKVTLDTKISMECSDPEPHPVKNEKVCFNVELDAEDATQNYCRWYDGNYNSSGDGFCCTERTIENFRFKEESEHNLKYYCTDALGNKGEVDEEKFKVTGDMFKIRLNDKWNLISVPFVLLNDKPEEVFEEAESVRTVWGYDGETGKWSVYRPGEIHTSNLESIEPGMGYWVLSDCNESTNPNVVYTPQDFRDGCGNNEKCEMLIVGGSLYNPGPVVPPSQQLTKGWNLIGYYGTEGRLRYDGPDAWYFYPSKEAYCSLFSLKDNWYSLVSYWEPYNPNSWIEYDECDKMNPGAGYWVAVDEDDLYIRSTICEKSFLQDVGCFFGDII